MAYSLSRPIAAGLIASLFLANAVSAGPAFPWFSTIDPRLVLCPNGDIAFHVIPRRGTSPMAGAHLVVDFCSSSGAVLCTTGQPATIDFWTPCQPGVFADGTGLATFMLKAGGVTSDSTVALSVDGVPFGHRFLSSVDQNGDQRVDSADLTILDAKLGSHDPTADFDGDGTVTLADEAILRAHLGHGCDMPTPATRHAWGEIKVHHGK